LRGLAIGCLAGVSPWRGRIGIQITRRALAFATSVLAGCPPRIGWAWRVGFEWHIDGFKVFGRYVARAPDTQFFIHLFWRGWG
jgi:hypothetical protein